MMTTSRTRTTTLPQPGGSRTARGALIGLALLLCLALAAGPAALAQPHGTVASPQAAVWRAQPHRSALPAGGPAPQDLQRFYEQEVDWYPCSPTGGMSGASAETAFSCATIQVPLDYDDPEGTTIDIALKRHTHTGDSLQGVLFANPGGPGGSGVALVESLERYVSPQVRQSYDVIGFDPRGVGASTAVTCPPGDDATEPDPAEEDADTSWSLEDSKDLPPSIDPLLRSEVLGDGPTDKEPEQQLAEVSRRYSELARRCESGTEPVALLDHVSTESAARDLDILRAAADQERLNYLGFSYGTFLGATYADLFPSRVGRLVLDGAMDPSLSLSQTRLDQANAFERALEGYVEYCQTRDECPLTEGVQAGVQRVRDLVASATQTPLTTSDPQRQVTGSELVLVIKRMLYAPEYWSILTFALSQSMSEGDGSTFALLYDQLTSGNQELAGAYNAITCQDYPASGSAQEWVEQYHVLRSSSPTFGESVAWSEAGCAAWGHSGTRAPSPVHARGAAPVLVVGTVGDPITPYEWSVSLADQLESARLLTWAGSGHSAYGRAGQCINAAVDAYLLAGTLPEEGATCP